MKIDKNLDREPNFDNQIDIEINEFNISINKKEVEIEHDWDYGWGGRGNALCYIPLDKLKELIKELEES